MADNNSHLPSPRLPEHGGTHSSCPSRMADVAPRWTIARKSALVLCSFLAAALFLVRAATGLSGEGGALPRTLGLQWLETTKTIAGERVAVGSWVWPSWEVQEGWFKGLALGSDAFLDMIAVAALAVVAILLYAMAGLREVGGTRIARRAVKAALLAALLAYTYHWCGIDPVGVWKSRSNAWTHLGGRQFGEKELAEIKADAERAPDYFAEGEANYIIGLKYKNVPPEQTPSTFAKQKEVREQKETILAGMDAQKRSEIIEAEHARLLDKKRGGYWPPELAPSRIWVYGTALLETIAIAIWASLMAVVCAVPLSVLAARNTLELIAPGDGAGSRAVRWVAVFVVRRFLDSCRGFNELVMALIFVSVIGLGPFAGILALWVHTTGVLGKVFSEAIEAIDPGQVEALVGAGAGPTQTISFSVIPQVMPTLISYSLLRFESNVRSAAILGWVGAGGIGFLLQDKMVGYSHREVCTMMIMIIAAVSLIDYGCGRLRQRFI